MQKGPFLGSVKTFRKTSLDVFCVFWCISFFSFPNLPTWRSLSLYSRRNCPGVCVNKCVQRNVSTETCQSCCIMGNLYVFGCVCWRSGEKAGYLAGCERGFCSMRVRACVLPCVFWSNSAWMALSPNDYVIGSYYGGYVCVCQVFMMWLAFGVPLFAVVCHLFSAVRIRCGGKWTNHVFPSNSGAPST